MQVLKVAILVCILASSTFALNGKCRALVLSGGGDKGSYQASAFITWTKLVSQKDLSYDVIAGVSVGSLNGSGLATFAPGDERKAADWIFNVWNDLTSNDVFTNWPAGILEGIFFKQGLFDNENLVKFFKEKLANREIIKKISIGSADMNTAKYVSFDYNSTDLTDDYINHVISSAQIPFAFPPHLENNMTLADGGVIWKMDIPGAIRRWLEIVDSEKDIIMDVIMTASSHLEHVDNLKRYSTLDHFLRGMEMKSFHKSMKILNETVIAHPDVNFRYVLGPSEKTNNKSNSIRFLKSSFRTLIQNRRKGCYKRC